MAGQRALVTPEQVWARYDAMEARLTALLSERMLELARLRPGHRVLDLATGRGEPAIAAAHRVGPTGQVVGVDVSASMLEMASQRAAREGLSHLNLRVMSACDLGPLKAQAFDAVLARWGLMYLDRPADALREAHRVLAPDGVLVAAVWGLPEQVPYFTLPRQLLSRYRSVPPIDFSAAGTFFYSDPLKLQRDLEFAGFRLDASEELDVPVMEAASSEDLLDWVYALGLARLLETVSDIDRAAWERDLITACEACRHDGLVRLGGVTRIVVASPTR